MVKKTKKLPTYCETIEELERFGVDVDLIREWVAQKNPLSRKFRAQIVCAFPFLAVEFGEPILPEIAMELEQIIDCGKSFYVYGGEVLGVKPELLKALYSMSVGRIGVEWMGKPYDLLYSLSLLQRSNFPETKEDWEIFTIFWTWSKLEKSFLIDEVFSEHFLANLCSGDYAKTYNKILVLCSGQCDRVDGIKDYFSFILRWCELVSDDLGGHHQRKNELVLQAASSLLCRFSSLEIIRQLFRWHEAILKEIATDAADLPWPPLPNLRTKDGFSVTALVSGSELVEEGRRMEHCVGWNEWKLSCQHGKSHILSVKDQNGVRVSTVQVELIPDACDKNISIEIVQHRGFQNSDPSIDAQMALNEWVEWVCSTDNQLELSKIINFHSCDERKLQMRLITKSNSHWTLQASESILSKTFRNFHGAKSYLVDEINSGLLDLELDVKNSQ